MIQSILDSVKKVLNIEPTDESFDEDVLMHINSVFSRLHTLGVGPVDGFMIEDKTPVWSDFLGDNQTLNHVKSYMYLRVRMMFDPPTLGYLIDAMDRQIKEFEWLINVQREDVEWTDPNPPPILEPEPL